MRAAPSIHAQSRFISGVVGAGGTGIEPATCGFGDRGDSSVGVYPGPHPRSRAVRVQAFVRSRLKQSKRFVVSFVVTLLCLCQRSHRLQTTYADWRIYLHRHQIVRRLAAMCVSIRSPQGRFVAIRANVEQNVLASHARPYFIRFSYSR
jgi:hypothetical protein